MTTAFAFVLLLSVLIFVHELGHFLVAKACGVRVLKFSLGFGPPVGIGRFRMRWTRGHTEYVVAWIPLGGFVKMLGEIPDEIEGAEARENPTETLDGKPVWQKLSVVFAGPAMNLLLPVVVFTATLAVGMPRALPTIGMVEGDSPAARAGLQVGDRITAIGGEPVAWWGDLGSAIRAQPAGPVPIVFERAGASETAEVDVIQRDGFDEFASVTSVGWVGVGHARLRALVGVPDANSTAHGEGLRSGDLVTEVAGESVADWEAFVAALSQAPGDGTVDILVARGEAGESVALSLPAARTAAALGIVPASVLVEAVEAGSPAAASGFESGDLILSVNGLPVGSFASFAEKVRTGGGEPLRLIYARSGETRTTTIAPELIPTDVGLGIEEPRYRIGIRGAEALMAGAVGMNRVQNPLESIPLAVTMTADITATFLKGLGKMLKGEVSRSNLAGPIRPFSTAGRL